MVDWFTRVDQVDFTDMIHDDHRTVEKAHGRLEIRPCSVIADLVAFEHIMRAGQTCIPMCVSTENNASVTESSKKPLTTSAV